MPSKTPRGIANFVSMWFFFFLFFTIPKFRCFVLWDFFSGSLWGELPTFLNKKRSLSSSCSLSHKVGIGEDLQLKSWGEKCFSWGLFPFLWLWILRINAVVWIPLGLHVFRTFPVRMWWFTWYMIAFLLTCKLYARASWLVNVNI